MKLLVIVGDLLLVNLLYFLLGHNGKTDGTLWLQSHIVVSALYFCFALSSGVVLHLRQVKRYQVLLKVLRNMLLFAFIITPLLKWGGFVMPGWGRYVLFLMLAVCAIAAWRLALRKALLCYRTTGSRVRNVVLVGSSDNMEELYFQLANPGAGYRVCGYFDDGEGNDFPATCPRLGGLDDVTEYLSAHPDVRYLYSSLDLGGKEKVLPIINYCENNLVHSFLVPDLTEYFPARVYIRMQGDVACICQHEEPLGSVSCRALKRAFDIVFSLLVLCIPFPFIFLLVFVMMKITMPGPIFFKQRRNGLNGKEFYCWKFRSMKLNAEADQKQACKGDPRITWWGEIMRKTNIDELPQFWNVLKGEMSVVGPRPHMVKHTEEYSRLIDKYMIRHWVKPGITGWSQVIGFRGETRQLSQMENRVRGDIWYIEHWSFGLDLYIIYKTITNFLHGDEQAV